MRRCWKFIVAAFLFVLSAASPTAQAQKRVALVIGNSAYQHAGLFDNPKNDAIDVTGALKKHGFQVIAGFDLDKAGMDRKIREFAEALPGATSAVFFYAGHGLQVSGHNYLVPIDAKLTTAAALDWEMVRLDLVHRSMEREAATSILFVDACRNNPLARNLARVMGTRSAEIGRGLAPVEAGVGTLVSFSTQPGNVALDGSGRNSPFAGALVKHIHQTKDDLSNILIAVRNDVLKDTKGKQVPWEHSALTGRFYLRSDRLCASATSGRDHLDADQGRHRPSASQAFHRPVSGEPEAIRGRKGGRRAGGNSQAGCSSARTAQESGASSSAAAACGRVRRSRVEPHQGLQGTQRCCGALSSSFPTVENERRPSNVPPLLPRLQLLPHPRRPPRRRLAQARASASRSKAASSARDGYRRFNISPEIKRCHDGKPSSPPSWRAVYS